MRGEKKVYVTVQQIITEFKLNPKQFGFKESNAQQQLETLVELWIHQATNAIDSYLSKSYPDDNIPGIISLACTEAVGNIIVNRRLRQDGSYIKSDDWTKEVVAPLDILDGVRELLEPLTQDEERYHNARVSCYAVTGEDIEEEETEE